MIPLKVDDMMNNHKSCSLLYIMHMTSPILKEAEEHST